MTFNDRTAPADETTDEAEAPTLLDIRHLTVPQLAQLGVSQIAYVKPVVFNGTPAFAIHAADGTPMAVTGERDVALAAIRQHEMVAALVH
ncbi:MAG TPA: DUF1150 family protein [Acetobacteraceae bacterium]|jgi:hypothetical protein|nr:DUF1150 family protein [Acetobacteraceae bacterium]